MKMKRLCAFTLALTLTAVSLAGCGSSSDSAEDSDTTSSSDTADSSTADSSDTTDSADTAEADSTDADSTNTDSDADSSEDSSDEEGVVWEEDLLDPDNPVTVRFYSYSYASAAFGTAFQTMMDEFNEGIGAEKGVILEFVADETGTAAETDIKAGLQVDIVQLYFQALDGAIDDMGISAYEDVFPADELEAHFEGISENALNLGVLDDQMYGLAFTFSTPILYVNGDLLEEAGLDPTEAPEDWEEMYEWCVQIKEETGKYGLALSPTNSTGWVTDSILYSNGATVLNEDRTAVEFASEEGIEAFEIWKQFYTDDVAVGGTDSEAMQAFLTGEAAMHIQSTSIYSTVVSTAESSGWTLYGYPMPGFDGEESVPTNSGSCIVVRPENEQMAQAIWEVIKYVTGDEGYTIITSETGYLPLRTYLIDDEDYLKDFVDENPIIRTNVERLDSIMPASIWPGEYATELQTLYADMATEALTTDADVAEIMQEYQDQMNSYIEGS